MPSEAVVAKAPKGKAWHSQSADEVLAQLASTAEGLSAQEAAQRLATDGPNELKEGKRISPLQIFLGQFKSHFRLYSDQLDFHHRWADRPLTVTIRIGRVARSRCRQIRFARWR